MQKRKRSALRGNILSMHGKLQKFSIESHLEFMTQRAKTQLFSLEQSQKANHADLIYDFILRRVFIVYCAWAALRF